MTKAIDCAICGGVKTAYLTTGKVMYPHRPDLEHILAYRCACGASVGCHPRSDRPLGNTADAKTKKARNRAHAAFDPIWRNGYKKRAVAYAWLAKQLGIEKVDCHIALFDADMCAQVVRHAEAFLNAIQAGQPARGMASGEASRNG